MSFRKGYVTFFPLIVAILLTIVILIMGCSQEYSNLSIMAAAGAKPAVDEVCREFEEQCHLMVDATFGGGGEVLSQMVLSKTGDIYIAPEQRFMEAAEEKGAINSKTIRSIAYMIPVIAVQKGNPKNISSLMDLAEPSIRVATSRPETTLLGKYAPEIFRKAGLFEAIEGNIVTETARPDSLLTMLTTDQIDTAVIWHFYQTLASEKIETIYLMPEQLTGIGEMQAAVSTYSNHIELAQKYIEYMTSTEGKAVFKKHGYLVDAEEVKQYWQ